MIGDYFKVILLIVVLIEVVFRYYDFKVSFFLSIVFCV